MATVLGNSAKVGIGATPTYIAKIRSVTFDPGERTYVSSEQLGEDVPSLTAGSKKAPTLKFTVERDTTDTNGQVALDTAYTAKTSLQITLAPEGNTAGNTKITGNAFVTTAGTIGTEKDKFITREYSLTFSGDYTQAVFP